MPVPLIDQDRQARREIRRLERLIDELLDQHGAALRDDPASAPSPPPLGSAKSLTRSGSGENPSYGRVEPGESPLLGEFNGRWPAG